jgi:tetratricopeptide (TPR) repeat protein
MILGWLDASKAVETGISLADQLAPRAMRDLQKGGTKKPQTLLEALKDILVHSDHGLHAADLNFYKRAKLANSFKWRLIESGVERATADEVTQELVLSLSVNRKLAVGDHPDSEQNDRTAKTGNTKQLLAQGVKCMAQGAYLEAIDIFSDLLELDPRDAIALNNLGAALSRLSRFQEAEEYFRSAVKIRPDFVEAHSNLGMVLRWRGFLDDSEKALRQALKLNSRYVDARIGLGMTLTISNRFREATGHFKKALKMRPRDPEVLYGMGQIAGMEGRFDESEKILKRALEVSPKMPAAWAALAGLRKMTPSDDAWLRTVEEIAAGSGIPPMESATLHFAMGKYYDDIGQFERAFKNFRTANELLKPIAESYDREARKNFVDRLIGLQPTNKMAAAPGGASASMRPVFVVGMMRSGTSLTEQIIASHPMAKGAGELEYWNTAVREHGAEMRQGQNLIEERAKQRLAEGYLRTLEKVSPTALRVIDKAPLNSDHLDIIHSTFPNARIIYMRRDPIDTCLSCYFQNFSLGHTFTFDLSDLAHYYHEHHRLMNHWRTVLPQGSILDVPYEELVADQEGWTRKMLDFIELEWDARCLEFQATERAMKTASFWQARQKIFNSSVQRWRNYEKFVDQVPALKKLHS